MQYGMSSGNDCCLLIYQDCIDSSRDCYPLLCEVGVVPTGNISECDDARTM